MTERVASDHDTVESHRVHVVCRTGRFELPLPDALSCESGEVVSLSLAGETAYAQIETTLDGEPVVRGAFPNRTLAKERDGENQLDSWIRETGTADGEPVLLDVLTAGYAYGVRQPGDRVIYAVPAEPDSSLQSIAENLED